MSTPLRPPLVTLEAEEVAARAARGEIHLVDVREDAEWEGGRIPGALHAPLSRFADVVGSLPDDRPVVFYCLVGGRSARAVSFCQASGLPHDTHLGGGIQAWADAGLPLEG